jgi:hypothetical protein
MFGASTMWAGNILTNPGFEMGSTAGWEQVPYCIDDDPCDSWQATSVDSHSGSYSALGAGNISLRQFFAPVLVSSISEISFWMRHPDGGGPAAYDFYYSDSSWNEYAVVAENSNWNPYDVTSSLASGKSLIGFAVFGHVSYVGGGSRTYLDDVVVDGTLSSVPEPGSLALIAAGAAVFFFRRRR